MKSSTMLRRRWNAFLSLIVAGDSAEKSDSGL